MKSNWFRYVLIVSTYFYSMIDVITTLIALKLDGIRIFRDGLVIQIHFYEKNPVANILYSYIGDMKIAVIMTVPIVLLVVIISLYLCDKIVGSSNLDGRWRDIYEILLFVVISAVYITVIIHNLSVIGVLS